MLSYRELMDQGPMTADYYLGEAVKRIDAQFGEGYAKKNPALVAEFMKVSALDVRMFLEEQRAERGSMFNS